MFCILINVTLRFPGSPGILGGIFNRRFAHPQPVQTEKSLNLGSRLFSGMKTATGAIILNVSIKGLRYELGFIRFVMNFHKYCGWKYMITVPAKIFLTYSEKTIARQDDTMKRLITSRNYC
jgi:hypothetical protein